MIMINIFGLVYCNAPAGSRMSRQVASMEDSRKVELEDVKDRIEPTPESYVSQTNGLFACNGLPIHSSV